MARRTRESLHTVRERISAMLELSLSAKGRTFLHQYMERNGIDLAARAEAARAPS